MSTVVVSSRALLASQGHNKIITLAGQNSKNSPTNFITTKDTMEMCKYKPYLKEFNYPNINGFSDEQIADIFTAENRCTLLTWLAKNLNSQFIVPLEWSNATEVIFSDFFHESGFCSFSQKLPFVRGDSNLSSKEQINIFDRIFNFLQNTSQKENVQPKQNAIHGTDLELFLKKDVNLFPTFGPVKLRTPKERQKKRAYLKEEIEKLRRDIGGYINHDNDLNFENSNKYEGEEIEENIAKFKKQAMKLQEVSSVVRNVTRNDDEVKKAGFKPDFGDHLISCNSEVTAVLQYFQNMNLTQSIDIKELQQQNSFEQNEISSIMKHHTQSSSDIVKTMKNLNNQ